MAGQPVNLQFPINGLSRNHPYALPPTGTTPAALNVRPEDAIKHRMRGGRRGGLTKQKASQASDTPVQHITVGTTVTNPGRLDSYQIVRLQQTADGQTHDTSIVLGNAAGDSYTDTQVVPDGIYDYAQKACCFDDDGNLYVYILDSSGEPTEYGRVYKFSPALAVLDSVVIFANDSSLDYAIVLCHCPAWGCVAVLMSSAHATWEGATGPANLFLIDTADMSIVAAHEIGGGGVIRGGLYGPGQGQLVWDETNEQLVVITARRQTTYGGSTGRPAATVFAFDDALVLQWVYDTAASDLNEARGGDAFEGTIYVPQCEAEGAKPSLYQLDGATGALIRYKEVPAIGGRNGDSTYPCSNCCVRSDGKVTLAYACKGAGTVEWSMELVCLEWNSGLDRWTVAWSYAKNSDVDATAIVSAPIWIWLDSRDAVYVNETAGPTGDYNRWKNAGDSLDVEVSVIKFSTLGAYQWYWDKDGPTNSWRAYSAPNRPGWGFAIYEHETDERSVATTDYTFVQDGRLYNSSNTEYPDFSGLVPLTTRLNDVQSAWAYQNLYFVDGENSRVLVLLSTLDEPWATYYHQSVDWGDIVVSHGEGTFQDGCRLICTYRGRVVLSGRAEDPHNWFMSAVNDPLNWDYAPAVSVATQAVAGNIADAGKIGDPVTALIPYNDDVLLFGGLHSISQLSGDAMDGGTVDLITDKTGIRFGSAFCRDPQGIVYFFGTDGVYQLAPSAEGTQVSSITEGRLDNEFDSISWAAYRAFMQWDYARAGLFIALIPYDLTSTTYVYFWSKQANSWWMDSYPATMGPSAIASMTGEDSSEERLLLGCKDGYIRYYNDSAETDDGTAITSYVDWPLPPMSLDMQQAVTHVEPVMGEGSADTTLQIFRGSTAQEAASATVPVLARTMSAGRSMPITHRIGGRHLRLRLASGGNRWAMEQLQVILSPIGRGNKR